MVTINVGTLNTDATLHIKKEPCLFVIQYITNIIVSRCVNVLL